ncbi:hypothetical protein [Desulfosporosinus acidiphilus]|uniref:hypothetical protein n=1 Tax=Desulfosporosinus acidiphilus TaxID=885581 RepID=UPI000257B2BB|nr:hypothetical protein [Desulfosporosinus acidiphilus]
MKSHSDREVTDLRINKGKLKDQILVVIIPMITVTILVGMLMYLSSKPPVYTISNGTLDISTIYGENVNIKEIQSVQLKNELPVIISKINGLDGFGSTRKGEFSSDIGNVTLYIDTTKPPFIYIKTPSELIILNNQSKSKTEALFNELNSDTKNEITN